MRLLQHLFEAHEKQRAVDVILGGILGYKCAIGLGDAYQFDVRTMQICFEESRDMPVH